METAICTLFEGSYHFGVGGLINSLYSHGYRGSIYVGFKGELPFWAKGSMQESHLDNCVYTKNIIDGLQVVFISLKTKNHLTNYKPDFMLDVWNKKKELEGIFYFDPDIILNAPWQVMIEWIQCGVAVSEDLNSPLQQYHPRRQAWRNYYSKYGIKLTFRNSIYVNGGFLGVLKSDIRFLEVWKMSQEIMAEEIGGLHKSIFSIDSKETKVGGRYAPFSRTDQDALNVAIEVYDKEISYGGKEVMGLTYGFPLIPHALGDIKPWKLNPIQSFFKGRVITFVEREYWRKYTLHPIKCHTKTKTRIMTILISITSFLSRFYKR